MKTTARLTAAVVAAALAAFVVAGAVLAASPAPTVGGQLAYRDRDIFVTSGGNVPARVTMSAESPNVALSESTFVVNPGETHHLTFTGPAEGRLMAHFEAIGSNPNAAVTGDLGTNTLILNLKPYVPPFDWSPFGIAGLVTAAGLLVLRRVKPWRYRLVKAAA